MEKAAIFGGKKFQIKYENGIVSVKPSEDISWVSTQTNPKHNLTNEVIGKMAQEIVRGLGL